MAGILTFAYTKGARNSCHKVVLRVLQNIVQYILLFYIIAQSLIYLNLINNKSK